jgi:hypothetical protein
MGIFSKIYRIYFDRVYPKIKWIRGTSRLRHFLFSLAERNMESYSGEPKDIFERGDWDNLIILDACRYDVYCDVIRDSEKRVTKASTSVEYLEETFSEGDFSDIVYVSANVFFKDQMMGKHIGRTGIFKEKFDTIDTDWDDEEGTTRPEPVARDALTAEKLFPESKKIIHFIQPHRPFIDHPLEDKGDVYQRAKYGDVDKSEVLEAYTHNLRLVNEQVEVLADKLSGKTVVTADHGEMLGENNLYEHLKGSDAKVLREVPWDELE